MAENHFGVPIVGQPFILQSGFLTLLLVCQCEKKVPLMLTGHSPSICPACLKAFQLESAHINADGSVNAKITIGTVQKTT